MLIWQHERIAREKLAEAGTESPGLCARVLTAHSAGLERCAYILARERELTLEQAIILEELIQRRCAGEPLAYLLGEKEFYGLPFRVSPDTLIPRPETEGLVELALEAMPADALILADLGSGCGCIGITLLALRPLWRGLLADLNEAALVVASRNAARHKVQPLIIRTDIFRLPFAAQSLDLLVSNPPYIGVGETADVMPDVLAYEPHSALFSEANGFAHLEAVIRAGACCLKPGGKIILEHGESQASEVERLLQRAGFGQIRMKKDLAGRDRYALAKKTG